MDMSREEHPAHVHFFADMQAIIVAEQWTLWQQLVQAQRCARDQVAEVISLRA